MLVNLTCPKCFVTVASIALSAMQCDAIEALKNIGRFHVCVSTEEEPKPQSSDSAIPHDELAELLQSPK